MFIIIIIIQSRDKSLLEKEERNFVTLGGINYANRAGASRCGNKPFSRAHVSIQEEL